MAAKRRAAPASLLTDPQAAARLEAAAQAAGLDLDGLAGLLIDAGLVRPEKDGIGEVLTLESLGSRMYAMMVEVSTEDQADWFKSLLKPQQVALIVNLRKKNFSSSTIAKTFDVGANTVSRIYNEYASSLGANVLEMRGSALAGIIQERMESLTEMIFTPDSEGGNSMSKTDQVRLAWSIMKEGVSLLAKLGLIEQAPTKIEITQKQTPSSKEDLMRELEELTQKRAKRMIEIGESGAGEEVERG
jgi:hypothetical protein